MDRGEGNARPAAGSCRLIFADLRRGSGADSSLEEELGSGTHGLECAGAGGWLAGWSAEAVRAHRTGASCRLMSLMSTMALTCR